MFTKKKANCLLSFSLITAMVLYVSNNVFQENVFTLRRTRKNPVVVRDNIEAARCIPESTDIFVVGAGLSGAVIAEHYARVHKLRVLVIDKRPHIGGNCHDYVDQETGILVNTYGLHMFHTKREVVMEYVKRFGDFARWDHDTLAYVDGKYVPVPVNIRTVNTLFDLNISSEQEMEAWLTKVQENGVDINNSEDMAISRVGRSLYEKIFLPYTIKQWDKHPRELGAEVTARIPVRYDNDMRYFTDKYQALPVKGYTSFFEKMFDSEKLITVCTGVDYFDLAGSGIKRMPSYKRLYFTGPIDRFFNETGGLEYRSLSFERLVYYNHSGYVQPASQLNFPSLDFPYTRSIEYKWFLHQKSNHSIIFREFSSAHGEPYYLVPTLQNKERYSRFKRRALQEHKDVIFLGRLANYKYFNVV